MMNGWMLRGAGIALVGTLSVSGASKTAPKDVEDALRSRVQQFYQLMVARKYRAAEELVAPESRDAYYTDAKPELEDFRITGIAWGNDFTTAVLTLVSRVLIRNPRIGNYEQEVPYASHWKFVGGQWNWFIPVVAVRETPFGMMRVDPNLANKSNIDLKAMIAKGPTPEKLRQGVDLDRTEVRVSGNKPQEVTVANQLPGRVTLSTQIVSGTGFDAILRDSDLAGSGKTRLLISRRRGVEFKKGRLAVIVQPTGQVLQVSVN